MSSKSNQKSTDELAKWREKIDALDVQIQTLINERAKCAQAVAALKESVNGGDPGYYRPEREAEILNNIFQRNKGPISDEVLAHMFREIMSACRALEKPVKVAYLGPEGTFTQEAALKQFGHSIENISLPSIEGVFREVESGNADYGVVPIENTTEGIVNHTLDSLIHSTLQICGEVELRIHHHLLSRTKDIQQIKRVYTHQHSIGQCRMWLDKHLSHAECVAVSSNSEGAKKAVAEKHAAAIASDSAAEIYKLHNLAKNIEDHPDNTTRFLIIGKRSPEESSHTDKTSLLLSAQNVPGALYELLRPLAENGISMTRIESRPSRRDAWDYVFFIDIDGHQNDKKLAKVLSDLKKRAALFKILGSYPKAIV